MHYEIEHTEPAPTYTQWNIATEEAIASTSDLIDEQYARAYGSAERRGIAQTRAAWRRLVEQGRTEMDWPQALAWASKVMALAARVAEREGQS